MRKELEDKIAAARKPYPAAESFAAHELIDPRALREEYKAIVDEYQIEMKSGCLANRVDFVPVRTDQPLGVMLAAYLATRSRLLRR